MKNFVIDASVAIKWYIPELLSEAADQFLQLYRQDKASLLAPDLLTIELGNALWKKKRAGEINSENARAILHALTDYCPLKLVPSSELMPAALDLALSLGFTVYDSLYLALAVASGAILVTADKEMAKLAAKSLLSDQVILLSDDIRI